MLDYSYSSPVDYESSLIERVLAGDSQAFDQLVGPHLSKLQGQARMLLRSNPDAEDVVQEAVLKAFVRLRQFRGAARFSTWLHRIVMNEAIQVQRRRSREGVHVVADPGWEERGANLLDTRPSALDALLAKERIRWTRKAVRTLPDSLKVVIAGHVTADEPIETVANKLSITSQAVKSRLHRVRRTLSTMRQQGHS